LLFAAEDVSIERGYGGSLRIYPKKIGANPLNPRYINLYIGVKNALYD